eukprot:TRINITY_DN2739_c0_g2_i1.p1 TRINITY_DN2739_c0_g2~~TRINITY_DN2739_c0_g2_i1.p1  ORF type:complete len:228 (+),score=15.76 TRINITY_DN2739_c0_g2_i1:62-745(+)
MGASPKPLPQELPSTAVIKRCLVEMGEEWLECLRSSRKVVRQEKWTELGAGRRQTEVLWQGAMGILLGIGCVAIGWGSFGMAFWAAALMWLGVFYSLRWYNRKALLKVVNKVLSAVQSAEARAPRSIDPVQQRIRCQVIATRLLMEALNVSVAGITWYPPPVEQITSEIESINATSPGLLSRPFSPVMPLPSSSLSPRRNSSPKPTIPPRLLEPYHGSLDRYRRPSY